MQAAPLGLGLGLPSPRRGITSLLTSSPSYAPPSPRHPGPLARIHRPALCSSRRACAATSHVALGSGFRGVRLQRQRAPAVGTLAPSNPRGPPQVSAFLELSAPAAAKWMLRLVSFYALLRLGVAKEVKGGAIDNAQSYIAKRLFGDADANREKEAKKAASKWKESTKGTLVRKLRVPSVAQGRKMLNAVAGVLSEDDLFVDVASHKGCQVRRETAHSQSVCCYNVRALFDELPTPHIEVEITVFPAGPLTSVEYQKAQKLEAVLRKGNAI